MKNFKYLYSKVLLSAGVLLLSPFLSSANLAQQPVSEVGSSFTIEKQAKIVILTADKPTGAAALGARTLAEHIRQATGADGIPIMKEGALPNATIEGGTLKTNGRGESTFIIVGESTFARRLGVTPDGLGTGGIRLKTVGNVLVLLGASGSRQDQARDDNATLYAVTTFLEEQLGVRYLWPGESGKVVPKKERVVVPVLDISYSPVVKQRHIRHENYQRASGASERTRVGLNHLSVEVAAYNQLLQKAVETDSASPEWFGWHKAGGSMRLVTGHSFGYMWEKYGQEHPEWFALQPDGSRDQSRSPARSRLCVSNEELQAAVARDRIEVLEQNPGQNSVSIDPNDGGYNTFCLCEECKKLDSPEGRPITLGDHTGAERKTFSYVSLTDRMVYFWNRIAEQVTEKYPEASLTVRAYSAYSDPPIKRRLHPNIVVEQVSQDYYNTAQTESYLKEWSEWGKNARQLAWRPNIDAGNRRHGFPTVYVNRMGRDVKARVQAGMVSTDIDSMSKSWATNSLNLYVLARLLWDPQLEVDAIVEDYCRSGFGEGAPFIKKYFQRLEEITEAAADLSASSSESNYRGRLFISTLAELYQEDVLHELHSLLDQAKTVEKTDESVSRRVEFLRRGLQLTAVQAEAFRLMYAAADGEIQIDKKLVLPFMEQRYSAMRDIFFNEPLAINIAYLLWGSEGSFRALQSKESWAFLSGGKSKDPSEKAQSRVIVDADEHGVAEEVEAAAAP